MFSLRKHLHIWKVLLGWIPYVVLLSLAIFDPGLLQTVQEWAIISIVAPMVQRLIIDLTENEWEVKNRVPQDPPEDK